MTDRSHCRLRIWLLWIRLLQMYQVFVAASDAHVPLPASLCEEGWS
jgi:hypothetical protein